MSFFLQHGWLDDPPNVDFLDIEFENEDKVELRKNMILGQTGEQSLTSKYITDDEVRLHTFFFTELSIRCP